MHTPKQEDVVKYMLLIYSDTENPAAPDPAVTEEYMAIGQEPATLAGGHLQPHTTATTVRVQDGRTLTTDGPFAETKEQLAGYYLIDADDLDAALDVAGRIPAARMGGAVEVRPLVER
jgi:hypothetical protein